MKRFAILGLALSGCFGSIVPGIILPDAVPYAPPINVTVPVAAPVGTNAACSGDSQCLGPSDVLVCDEFWHCWASHMISPPTPQSKNQGQFLRIHDGQTIWTDRWFQTRPLAQGEPLQLGEPVLFYFNNNNADGSSGPPKTHNGAITNMWAAAQVTDLSNLFKSILTVSFNNGATVATNDVRVITNAGTTFAPTH